MLDTHKIIRLAFILTTLTTPIFSNCIESSPPPKTAIALLTPTKGNRAQGVVTFTQTPEGVQVIADVDYLEPGKHGFQIHTYGDCSAADGRSIGPIYNPKGLRHSSPYVPERQVGALGNIVADEMGHAHLEYLDRHLKIDGATSILGRSLAIHANPDDMTSQPSGNVGGCVACGIID